MLNKKKGDDSMCKLIEGTEAVIDRIEGEIVVIELEDETIKQVFKQELPEGIQEGYVLRMEDGKWVLDMEAYGRKKAEVEALFEDFF